MSKKGENIYKRKDGRWEARYIKGYTPEGSARFGYCYAKSYREAREKLHAAQAALAGLIPVPDTGKRKRFGIYCDEWLQLRRSTVKESTLVKYTNIIEKHIKPRLGGYFLQALSSVMVESFSFELLEEEGLAPKTVRDILTVLRSVLAYVERQSPNVLPNIDIVYPKDSKKEMRVLTQQEQNEFVRYLMEDMDECKFGVLLALMTGMRIGEVCALRWCDVDIKDKIIKVTSTMQRLTDLSPDRLRKTKIVISEPKSDQSYRIIPLTKQAAELCKRWKAQGSAAFVLTGEEGRFIEPRTMQYRLEQYTKDCNLEDVHFHVLRHTFATRAVEVGFEIKTLSEVLGHSSPRITLERYVHSSLKMKRDNMKKLAVIGL